MKRIAKYFFNGLIFIVPLILTLYIIYASFTSVDEFIQHYSVKYITIKIPGAGIIAMIIAITIVGFVANSFIFKPFHKLIDKIFRNIPLINILYTSIKDMLMAFMGDDKKYDKPVLVLMNKETKVYKIGFMTADDLSRLGIRDLVAVYFTHAFTFSGELYLVDKENITPLNISSTEAMQLSLSGGVTGMKS
jgi:uncharacterized membrane protein